MTSFAIDDFVERCIEANQDGGQPAVRDIIDQVISTPADIEAVLGDTTVGAMQTPWHQSEDLTILHLVWPPGVDLFPHNHNMWANIGIYGGREDNTFYKRLADGRIEANTSKTLIRGDTTMLGSEAIHSVANPTREWTAAIHIYGGEFYKTPRTAWSAETGEPVELDTDVVTATVEAAATAARARE